MALIPAYNEGHRVAAVAKAAQKFLPTLVIDDGSSDDTAAHAESSGAEVFRQLPNQGKGVALRTGFRMALERGHAAVLTLDADGQHDPAQIPYFLEAWQTRHADLIIGSRNFKQMPPVRRFANTVGTWAFSWALGTHVPDNQSGYRLLSRRLIEALQDSNEQGFEFEVEMIVRCAQLDYPIDWVTIRTIYADETSHIQRGAHVKHFFRMVWQTRLARKKQQEKLQAKP
jgi:glycosyltransferase involved in cell wall biosynthesis